MQNDYASVIFDEDDKTPEQRESERLQKEAEKTQAKKYFESERAERLATYNAMAPAEGFLENTAAVIGRLGAALPQYENAIGGFAGGAKTLPGKIGEHFAEGALVNTAIEPLLQTEAINRGTMDDYSLQEGLMNVGLGGVATAGLGGAGHALGRVFNRPDIPEPSSALIEEIFPSPEPLTRSLNEDVAVPMPREDVAVPMPREEMLIRTPEQGPVEPEIIPVREEIPSDQRPVDLPETRPSPEITITAAAVRDPKIKARATQDDVFEFRNRKWQVSEVHGAKEPVVIRDPDGLEVTFSNPAQMARETGIRLDSEIHTKPDTEKFASISEMAEKQGINLDNARTQLGKDVVRELQREWPGVFRKDGQKLDDMREWVTSPESRFTDIPEDQLTPDDIAHFLYEDLNARKQKIDDQRIYPIEAEPIIQERAAHAQRMDSLAMRAKSPENLGMIQAPDMASRPIGVKGKAEAQRNAEAAERKIEETFRRSSDEEVLDIQAAQEQEFEDLMADAKRHFDEAQEHVPDYDVDAGRPVTKEEFDKLEPGKEPGYREKVDQDAQSIREQSTYEAESGDVGAKSRRSESVSSDSESSRLQQSESDRSTAQSRDDAASDNGKTEGGESVSFDTEYDRIENDLSKHGITLKYDSLSWSDPGRGLYGTIRIRDLKKDGQVNHLQDLIDFADKTGRVLSIYGNDAKPHLEKGFRVKGFKKYNDPLSFSKFPDRNKFESEVSIKNAAKIKGSESVKAAADKVADDLNVGPEGREFLDDLTETDLKAPLGPLDGVIFTGKSYKVSGDMANRYGQSMDANLRSRGRKVAKQLGDESIADDINEFGAEFSMRAGEEAKHAYWVRSDQRIKEKQNHINNILNPLFKKVKANRKRRKVPIINKVITTGIFRHKINIIPEASNKRLHALITGQKVKGATSAERKAANEIRKWFKEWRDYRIKAGEKLGDIGANYFPRIFDESELIMREGEFIDAARKLYSKIYEDADQVKLAADALYNRMLGKWDGDDFIPGELNPYAIVENSKKARVFDEEADALLASFYVRDIGEVMTRYNMGATKAAEITRLKPRLQKIKDRVSKKIVAAKKAGKELNYDIIARMEEHERLNFQTYRSAQEESTLRDTLSTITYTKILGRSLMTSLAEPLLLPTQYGVKPHIVKAAVKSYTDIPKLLWSEYTNKTYAEKSFAELTGVVTDALHDTLYSNRMNLEQMSTVSREIMMRFFQKIGLEQFTRNNRIQAAWAGRSEIALMADRVLNAKGTKKKRAEFALKEIGIEDPAAFSKWIDSNFDGFPPMDRLGDSDRMMQDYKRAVNVFVKRVVMEPNRAEKPVYASKGPIVSLIYSIQSFNHSAYENVVKRNVRMMRDGKDNGMILPTMLRLTVMMPALIALTAGVDAARTYLYPEKQQEKRRNRSDKDKLIAALDRSPFMPPMASLGLNAYAGVRYRRNPLETALGAVWGSAGDAAAGGLGLYGEGNSDNTQAAERRAARALYDYTAAPIIANAIALSKLPPGVAATYYATLSDRLREEFVTQVGGDATKAKRSSRRRR